jgi:hypothetical protein
MVEKPIEGQNMAIFLQSEPMRGGLGVGTLKELAGGLVNAARCYLFKLFIVDKIWSSLLLSTAIKIIFQIFFL